MYFVYRRQRTDTRISPTAAQVRILIAREQRLRGAWQGQLFGMLLMETAYRWQGQLFGMLGEGTKTGKLSMGPALFGGCTPYPLDSSGTPLSEVRHPRSVGRGAGSGSPRLAPPVHTSHRPGAHVPGRAARRRRTARGLARPLLRAHVRALRRKEVRVARSVTKFTAFALRCVQCT